MKLDSNAVIMLLVITSLFFILVNSDVKPIVHGCLPITLIRSMFVRFWMVANPHLYWDERMQLEALWLLLNSSWKVNGTFSTRVGRNFWSRPRAPMKTKVYDTMNLFQRWQVAGLEPYSKYGCSCVYYPVKDIMEMACFFEGKPDS